MKKKQQLDKKRWRFLTRFVKTIQNIDKNNKWLPSYIGRNLQDKIGKKLPILLQTEGCKETAMRQSVQMRKDK